MSGGPGYTDSLGFKIEVAMVALFGLAALFGLGVMFGYALWECNEQTSLDSDRR